MIFRINKVEIEMYSNTNSFTQMYSQMLKCTINEYLNPNSLIKEFPIDLAIEFTDGQRS